MEKLIPWLFPVVLASCAYSINRRFRGTVTGNLGAVGFGLQAALSLIMQIITAAEMRDWYQYNIWFAVVGLAALCMIFAAIQSSPSGVPHASPSPVQPGTGSRTENQCAASPVSRKGPLLAGRFFVVVLLAAAGYGTYYGYQRLGGNDVVVGYSTNSPEGAEQDAVRTLDAKYQSWEIVSQQRDDSGTSIEQSFDYHMGAQTYRKGTWKCTIRVKNAVKR